MDKGDMYGIILDQEDSKDRPSTSSDNLPVNFSPLYGSHIKQL